MKDWVQISIVLVNLATAVTLLKEAKEKGTKKTQPARQT